MAVAELYPFSTARGDAVPLEIVRPLGLAMFTFDVNTVGSITIPAGFNTCWLYATEECVVNFSPASSLPGALGEGTEYPSTIFIPKQTPICIQVAPGEGSLLGLATAGRLYVNNIQQWAALTQQLQTQFG